MPGIRSERALLIGGRWLPAGSGGRRELVDPGTAEPFEEVPYGDEEDLRAAIDAAAAAQDAWAERTPYARAEVLDGAAAWILERAEALARETTLESGKPLGESLAEWRSAAGYLRWFAAEGARAYGRIVPARAPGRRIRVRLRPVGVVGAITAWNFPVYNPVRCWAAALAAGCAVVARPSEFTPVSALRLAEALHASGAPAGVINVVHGDPEGCARAMLEDPRVRKIAFTGSPRVGRILMDGASRTLTRLSLELGGNAPVLVLPDVPDPAALARDAATWKLRNAGQVCVAPQRFLVHEEVADAFEAAAVEAMRGAALGHGLEPATRVGPLIHERARARVEALIEGSRAAGATVRTGGGRPERPGFFLEPAVLTGAGPGVPAFDEEAFGPLMPITRVTGLDEAIRLANATEAGLASFVFTRDLYAAEEASERLEAGMVCVNDWLPATPEAPFGGVKGSGIGRETGSEGLREYLEETTVFIGTALG